MPCIIDTNILVDSLREKPEAIAYLESKKGWTYSVVNTMELMAGARNKKEIAELEKYLGDYQEDTALGKHRLEGEGDHAKVLQG